MILAPLFDTPLGLHEYLPLPILSVPTAVIVLLGVPAQTLTGGIAANEPVATRTTMESILVQPVVALRTVTTYLLLSTVGDTEGAAAVGVVRPGPDQLYVKPAFGDRFRTIEPFVQIIFVGGGGKPTLGNGLTLIVVVAEAGQSPILAEIVMVVVPTVGVRTKNILPSEAEAS